MATTPAASGTSAALSPMTGRGFFNKLKKVYTWYTGGFVVFVIALAIAEQMGSRGGGSATSS